MTSIIAIETATEACSAALLWQQENNQTIYKRFQLAPREHTKLILPMLDEVLADAQLKLKSIDAIAFGRGPGAFTGLRIATGIAQGLALSVDKPIIAISSLSAMALAALKECDSKYNNPKGNDSKDHNLNISIVVAIDARMGEVYWAEYAVNDDKLELIGKEQLTAPTVMFEKIVSLISKKSVVVIGSGWDVYLKEFQDSNADLTSLKYLPNKFPDAEEISQLALLAFEKEEFQSVEEAQPVYLRNNVAEKSKKRV